MRQSQGSDQSDWPQAFGTAGAAGYEAEAAAHEPSVRAIAGGQAAANALEDVRAALAEFEQSLRARSAAVPAPVNGNGVDHSSAGSDAELRLAAEEVARCRSQIDALQGLLSDRGYTPDGSELPFAALRRELLDAGRRTEKIVESVADALERIDAERLLVSEQYAEHMEATRAAIESWRGEQKARGGESPAGIESFLDESNRVAESMRQSYTSLGAQLETLQTAAGSFQPLFEEAERRLAERFDEQQAELARQRGWIEQKLEEMRSDLDRSQRSEMAHTRSFVLVLQFGAALLPVAAVALALFLPSILRWLHIGS